MEKGKRYIVTYPFRDLRDRNEEYPNGKVYAIGDIYLDMEKQDQRIRELAGDENNAGRPLIELEAAEKNIRTLDYDDITKADIIKELKEDGVEHNSRDTKEELYKLLLGSD